MPGVLYGTDIEPTPVAVELKALRQAMSTESGANALLSLEVDGTRHLALAREFQRHPVRGNVIHVDFHVVRRDRPVLAEVPIVLTGEALEVHRGDGLVDQQLFTLSIHALPGSIPSGLEVDVTDLVIGGAIRVADLALPSGVATDVDPEAAIVVGQPPRVQALGGGEEAVSGPEGSTAGGPGGSAPGGGE